MFQVLVLRKSKRRSLLELKDKAWLWTAYRRDRNEIEQVVINLCYTCEWLTGSNFHRVYAKILWMWKIFLVLDDGSLCLQVTARLKGNFHWKTLVKNGKLLSCTILHVICWQFSSFFRNNVKQKISMVNDVGELVFHGKNFIERCTKYVPEKNINSFF